MPLTSRRLRAALLATASVTLVAATLPAPEPLGIGDRLFPHLGNPGYDVLSYDISLTYRGSNTKPLDAVTTIDARTTAPWTGSTSTSRAAPSGPSKSTATARSSPPR